MQKRNVTKVYGSETLCALAKKHKDICDRLSKTPNKKHKVKSFHTNIPQEEGIAILHNAILAQFPKETFNVILIMVFVNDHLAFIEKKTLSYHISHH